MTQGRQCEGTKLRGLRRKIQRLRRQDILTIHADKDVKKHTIVKTKAHNCKRSPPAKDGPEIGQKSPGPTGLGGPAQPIFVVVRAPFGLGLLRDINSLAAKIRRHPSTGTRRNLVESDDGRRESLKLSRRWPRPTLAAMAALHS
jgi:hypothetical protein